MLIQVYGETVDTRAESSCPGPYCDGLSVLLHVLDTEDEAYGDFCVYGTGRRFGRRVLWCDTQGFMSTTTFADEAEASACLRAWADEHDPGDEF